MRQFVKLIGLTALIMTTAMASNPAIDLSKEVQVTEKGTFLSQKALGHLKKFYTNKQLQEGVNVGMEFCIACHQDYAQTRYTSHATTIREALPEYSMQDKLGVVMDYDDNGIDDFADGLDFNQISSAFDRFKPNAPILSLEGGTYYVTIGELKMPVVGLYGGRGLWKQRLLLRIPVTGTADGYSNENYISPIQYNETVHKYSLYHPEAWYDDSDMPRFEANEPVTNVAAENARSFAKKCMGCHTNGIRSITQDANGEWIGKASPASLPVGPGYPDLDRDGVADLVNTDCESCHGPGSAHIMSGGDPSTIINPSKLDSKLAADICGRCHHRVKSVPNGLHDWPVNDETYEKFLPGMSLDDFYTSAAGTYGDGKNSRQHHQQYPDLMHTNKVAYGYACYSCHDVHYDTPNMIRTEIVKHSGDVEYRIATAVDDNTLCLACHATHGPFSDVSREMMVDYWENYDEIGKIVSAHSKHPYAPERKMGLSRCTECHMPYSNKSAVPYDVRSHTFEAIPPVKTLDYAMPNSCAASCHGQKAILFDNGYDFDISNWADTFDEKEAEALMEYYGPGGMWWNTQHD